MVSGLWGNTTLGLSAALKDLKEQVQLHSSYQALFLLSILEVAKNDGLRHSGNRVENQFLPPRKCYTYTNYHISC